MNSRYNRGMRSITVKIPDDIAARMEGEAQVLHRDLAELAGERLAQGYAAAPVHAPPAALPEELRPLTALQFDTAWASADDNADESDAALLSDIRRFLGREIRE